MSKPQDLIGRLFGQLTVKTRVANTLSGKIRWKCRCSCGNTTDVRGDNLTGGKTLSCGCSKTGRKSNEERRQASATDGDAPNAKQWPGASSAQPFVKKIQIDEYDSLHPSAGGVRSCGFGHAEGIDVNGVAFKTFTKFVLRPRRQGVIHVLTIRTLEHLAALGHITPQGNRSYDQWMYDSGVAVTMVLTGDTHSIGLEFEKLGGFEVWPRDQGEPR